MNRIRAAWAALLGRPVITNVIFDDDFRYSEDNAPGGVVAGNTIRREQVVEEPRRRPAPDLTRHVDPDDTE